MLIGVGGCGKHSLARLAGFAAGCEVFEIALSRGYNEISFKEDLKVLFNNLMKKPTIFLFSSAQVSVKTKLRLVMVWQAETERRQTLLKMSHFLSNVKQKRHAGVKMGFLHYAFMSCPGQVKNT